MRPFRTPLPPRRLLEHLRPVPRRKLRLRPASPAATSRYNPPAPKPAPVLALRESHSLRPLSPRLVCIDRARRAPGAPQGYANLSVYPIIAPPAALGAGSFADEADYLVLDEALQRKLARVTEVSEGGSVPELAFENFAGRGVLLLDGEELVGARQNRILNISVLVGAQQKITIPVSCVEHGRWRYNSAEFASTDQALFSRARADKARHVSALLRQNGSRRSEQGEVWDRVAEKSAKFSVRSGTRSMEARVRAGEGADAAPALTERRLSNAWIRTQHHAALRLRGVRVERAARPTLSCATRSSPRSASLTAVAFLKFAATSGSRTTTLEPAR